MIRIVVSFHLGFFSGIYYIIAKVLAHRFMCVQKKEDVHLCMCVNRSALCCSTTSRSYGQK